MVQSNEPVARIFTVEAASLYFFLRKVMSLGRFQFLMNFHLFLL